MLLKVRILTSILLIPIVCVVHAEQRATTIGDVLKKIDQKSKKTSLNKKNTSLPSFKSNIEKREVRKHDLSEIKPTSSKKFFRSADKDEAQLLKYTDEEIKQLFSLAKQFKKSDKRGEIWLRLAEAYVEKAKFIELKIQEDYEKKMIEYRSKKRKTAPRMDLKDAQAYNKKAIQLYEWFLRDFPKDSKVPQALFFLGYNYFELENYKKGFAYYNNLVKQYPKSHFVAEAYFAMGEHYFENEKWPLAKENYKNVIRYKDSRLYEFGLYKMGWCEYKTGQIRNAISYMEKVIEEGQKSGGGNRNSNKIRLVDEATRDLIPFFVELGDYKQAKAYFNKVIPRDKMEKTLERLAYYYYDIGNSVAAQFYFKDLIDRDPYAPKAFDYQYQIVKMYSTSKNSKVFRAELYDWVQKYGPDGNWARNNKDDQKLVSKASELMEITLRTFILQRHQTAQNSRGSESQFEAKTGYELYFNTFKNSTRLDEMHFFYGELLFDMKDYNKAAYHYLWVVDHKPDSKYAEKATNNSLLALEKKLPTPNAIQKVVGRSTAPVKLDKVSQVFMKAAENYFKTYPKGENVVGIKYKMATIYYSYNHIDKAIEIYTDIVKNHSDKKENQKFVEASANLILDIYSSRKDYDNLSKSTDMLLAIPSLSNSDFGKEVKNIKTKSTFKRAQDLEGQKKYLDSAKSYEAFSKTFPSSNLAAPARYNAGVNYERSNELLSAISMYTLVLKSNDKKSEPLRRKARKFLPVLYEKTGLYLSAAAAYEDYADSYSKDSNAADFYFNAAVVYDSANYYTSAIRNYDQYFKYKKGIERVESLYYIGKIWQRRGNRSKAKTLLEKYVYSNPVNASHVIESSFFVAQYHDQNNNLSNANKWYRKTISMYKAFVRSGKKVGVKYAAESEFKLAYQQFLEVLKIKVPKDPRYIAKVLLSKINGRDLLARRLKSVVSYDVGEPIVGALTIMGQLNQHIYAMIVNSPIPNELLKSSEKERLVVYKKALLDKSEPFKEEAIKSYKAAIDKSQSFESYGIWLEKAQSDLYQLTNPGLEYVAPRAYSLEWLDDLKNYDFDGYKDEDVKLFEDLASSFSKSKLQEVSDQTAKILEKYSEDFYALSVLSWVCIKEKKLGLAKMIINRALKKHPKQATLYNNLAIIQLQEEDPSLAITLFKKASKFSNKKQIHSAANLGSIYVRGHDYKRALSPMKTAYDGVSGRLNSEIDHVAKIYNNYALVLWGVSKIEEAETILERVADKISNNTDVLMNLALLKVESHNKKDEAEKLFSKIKYMTTNAQDLAVVKKLEERLNEKTHD